MSYNNLEELQAAAEAGDPRAMAMMDQLKGIKPSVDPLDLVAMGRPNPAALKGLMADELGQVVLRKAPQTFPNITKAISPAAKATNALEKAATSPLPIDPLAATDDFLAQAMQAPITTIKDVKKALQTQNTGTAMAVRNAKQLAERKAGKKL